MHTVRWINHGGYAKALPFRELHRAVKAARALAMAGMTARLHGAAGTRRTYTPSPHSPGYSSTGG